MTTLSETDFSALKPFKKGKVRDVYDLGDKLLIVATDRLSAFDVVLPDPIPDKGKILTQLSLFWFDFTSKIIPNHLIAAEVDQYPAELKSYRESLDKRSMLVKKAKLIEIECVVRGYLAGSGWKEYQKSGTVCGIKLPAGLRESVKLPEPIFTPATKEATGHDINISEEEMVKIVGPEVGRTIKEKSLALYRTAAEYAEKKGIIIADTKFEFGKFGQEIILIDEILTPDSSRFWPMESYEPGSSPPSFDKQFVRDYLESIKWNKEPPAPPLPAEVVQKTREKYFEAFRKLTGRSSL